MEKITKLLEPSARRILEAKHGAHAVLVNRAVYESVMNIAPIVRCEYVTMFSFFDRNGNYVCSEVKNMDTEELEYYVVK